MLANNLNSSFTPQHWGWKKLIFIRFMLYWPVTMLEVTELLDRERINFWDSACFWVGLEECMATEPLNHSTTGGKADQIEGWTMELRSQQKAASFRCRWEEKSRYYFPCFCFQGEVWCRQPCLFCQVEREHYPLELFLIFLVYLMTGCMFSDQDLPIVSDINCPNHVYLPGAQCHPTQGGHAPSLMTTVTLIQTSKYAPGISD